MDDLRERVRKYHELENISYKTISLDAGIPVRALYNFTSGIRDLKKYVAESLDEYLKTKGY